MPIKNLKQPNIIQINSKLRLKAYDGNYTVAIAWYQDKVVYYNSEGINDQENIPDKEYIKRMYTFLNSVGELYFIEVKEHNKYIPIGDVTLRQENPPIAIGVSRYRGKGIGKLVMQSLIHRAKQIGMKKITNTIIYDYNFASQKLFESLGFICIAKNNNQLLYELTIE